MYECLGKNRILFCRLHFTNFRRQQLTSLTLLKVCLQPANRRQHFLCLQKILKQHETDLTNQNHAKQRLEQILQLSSFLWALYGKPMMRCFLLTRKNNLESLPAAHHLSRVTTKSVFGVSYQVQHRPDCEATENG